MLSRFVPATIALLLATAAASAASASDFSGTACNSPKFEAFMQARLGHGQSGANPNRSMPTRFDYGTITSATTVSNTGSSISCQVTVPLDTVKGTKSIKGVFTANIVAGAQPRWRWAPGY